MKKLLLIVIALLLIFVLVSCGGDTEEASGSNSNSSTPSTNSTPSSDPSSSGDFSKQAVKDDRALLEGHSYEVYTYYASSTNLSYAESQISAKTGTLKAYLYAYDSDGHGIYIYYLNNENDAKDCYDAQSESVKSAYRLEGNKLFLNDTTGLFN